MWQNENPLEEKGFQKDLKLLKYFILCSFFLLLFRLFYLQFLKSKELVRTSEKNRIQIFPKPAVRGNLYDRKGGIIATSRPSFSLIFYPMGLTEEEIKKTIKRINKDLNFNYKKILDEAIQNSAQPFMPVIVNEDLSREKVIKISEEKFELPGIDIRIEPKRYYKFGKFASHLIGYLGEIDKRELESLSGFGYRLGDIIGKTGIEKIWDHYLRGRKGGKKIEVDAKGKQRRFLGEIKPQEGYSLVLTIDNEIQAVCEAALRRKSGAICAMNPKTGEILAMVSSPCFDPNIFTGHITKDECNKIFKDKKLPMFNRVIQAQYAPGSVFKLVTAMAGLEEEVVKEGDTFLCRGKFICGKDRREFKCWKKKGHGNMSMVRAIAESCDVYFYNLGLKAGIDKILKYAKDFGFPNPTDVDLPEETNGFLPDPKLKKPWCPGDTVNTSIGQGYVLVTPIQMARFCSAIANGGKIYKPFVVRKIMDNKGKTIREFNPILLNKTKVSEEVLDIIKEGMRGAVLSGTSQAVKFRNLKVCGKTGTTQNPHGEDHAWFICYAPAENPTLALSILVEHGGQGSRAAAPIARKILKKVFPLGKKGTIEIFARGKLERER